MGKYSIKEIEQLTGIKAHTFRVWEQRYNILIPHRTETNIRFYDDEQLKLALNLSYLNKNGFKISKLALLNQEQISRQVTELSAKEIPEDLHLNALIVGMIEMNRIKFVNTLKDAIRQKGVESTFEEIVFPFLRKIGFMWANGSISPAQEHFASDILRRELIVNTALLPENINAEQKILLFLPENELHEIGLLLADYMVRARGFHSSYLGASVPLEDVESVVKIINPQFLFCIITNLSNGLDVQAYINKLSKLNPSINILITGFAGFFTNIDFPKNVIYLLDLTATKDCLDNIQ